MSGRRPGPLTLVAAPDALGDVRAARAVLDRALAARGVTGTLVPVGGTTELAAVVARLPPGCEPVVAPGVGTDVDSLGLPGDEPLLRLDLADRPRDPSPRVRRHVRGRGLDGIRYAVDAWSFHRTCPPTTYAFGPDRDQRADLRLPTVGPRGARHPVAVLVHGGYWRSRWESDLMEPMAADLVARGWATWNVEYRRPDDHSWDATTADVAAALDALADVDAPVDLHRVVLLGHSAGGQLAVRLAADVAADPSARVRPVLTVSLAGVLDLVEADRRWLGDGAVSRALGGRAEDVPAVYRASSPRERLPIGSPVAVCTGDDDELLDLGRAFARAAAAAGEHVPVRGGEGDHFAVIDPASPLWRSVVGLLSPTLLSPTAHPDPAGPPGRRSRRAPRPGPR